MHAALPDIVTTVAAFLCGALTAFVFLSRRIGHETLGIVAGCAVVATFGLAIAALVLSESDMAEIRWWDIPTVDRWRFAGSLWPLQSIAFVAGSAAVALGLQRGAFGGIVRDPSTAPEDALRHLAVAAFSILPCMGLLLSIGSATAIAVEPWSGAYHAARSMAFVCFGFMFWTMILSFAARPCSTP